MQPALTTNHVAIPDGQVSGETNYFQFVCRDEAGNAVTKNNGGELLLLADNAGAPIPLTAFSDDAADWEELEVDLTPCIGQVVYLAWHYVLFSLDSAPRTGWLADEISVMVSNPPVGNLSITNHVWQARFNRIDPLAQSSRGKSLLLSNAPIGTNAVQYEPVDFYQKPPGQTHTLTARGNLTITGDYTFADANSNGIADAWEQFYFGNVASNRTAQTDSGGDGLKDLGEFQLGTVPTNAVSRLRPEADWLTAGSIFRLQWDSAPDHAYQVWSSSNLLSWTPQSGWLHPTAYRTTFGLVNATNVWPGCSASKRNRNQSGFARLFVAPRAGSA